MIQRWYRAAGLLSLFSAAVAWCDDGIVDRTASSPLHHAHGFAKHHQTNAELVSDPRVIFADDFESGDFSNWDEHTSDSSIVSLVADPVADPRVGTQVMRVTATLRENTGGGATKLFQPSDPLFIRYYVKFAPDCDYTHHQVRIRANKGLTGRDKWSGFGQAGLRPDGVGRFVTGVEPWGNHGKTPPPGRWSFYTYWPDMKAAPDGKFWGNQFLPADGTDIPRDRWICVEVMIKHNTPGEQDGEQAFWIDGQLQGHWTGFRWRTSPTLWANSLALESYVTDRWTRNRINTVYFDNVVVAKEYIGPVKN